MTGNPISRTGKCGNCPRATRQAGPPLAIPRRGYTPSRPSCIDCVEKHLGAACVLLAETREGYAYRLRAVGHLFEAEDESQQWPELHCAIREARTRYQASGGMPDWQALDDLLREVADRTAAPPWDGASPEKHRETAMGP